MISRKAFVLILSFLFLISCNIREHKNNLKENKNCDSSSLKQDALNDSSTHEIDSLFQEIDLPIEINYSIFSNFDKLDHKTIIPQDCFSERKDEKYQGLPITIEYAFGKIRLQDSIELFLTIKSLNPENALDFFFISANIYVMENEKLSNGVEIAKYHAYSQIMEEYYCVIDELGNIKQNFSHVGEIDGFEETFKKGDTTYNLLAYFSINNYYDSFQTYVIYEDFLPIYDFPDGGVVAKFRFEDDSLFDFGKTIIFDSSTEGWLRIKEIHVNLDCSKLIGKWIKSDNVEIGTTNYCNRAIFLKEEPMDSAEIAGTIDKETHLSVLMFYKGWALVEYNGVKGWLAPKWICNNEVTNCN